MAGTNPMGEQGKVTYTVKELLGDIRDDVKEIKGKLDNKADRQDLAALETRLVSRFEKNETRVDALENNETGDTRVDSFKKWLIASAFTSISALVGVIGIVYTLLHNK